MPMKNPPHPGHSIKDACLDPPCLSVTEAARVLGIARHTLSRVLNGRAGISADMALRLEKAGWSSADHWLRLQAATGGLRRREHVRSASHGYSGWNRIATRPSNCLLQAGNDN